MKVKELIEKLNKCNPESEVHLETFMDSAAKIVAEYTILEDDKQFNEVYICDRPDAIADQFEWDDVDYEEKII